MTFSSEKNLVRGFFSALAEARVESLHQTIADHCVPTLTCYLSFPWRQITGPEPLAKEFWEPLKTSFTAVQRREDIFFAGKNPSDGKIWVVSMGHYMGLFDRDWIDIPPTGRTTMIRYAEFHQVESGQILQSGIFVDLIGVMRQAGYNPLPEETGHSFVSPGPRTHDGIQHADQDPIETQRTADLINRLVADLDTLNVSGDNRCPPELLARTMHDDLVWHGPAGIGATQTILRYQQQHQFPFREGLTNKVFNGHIARLAEGTYGGYFGWPNLSNSPAGFLGVAESDARADMQVVDIYRREGDKIAENWVIIDIPYWLNQLGIDVFDCIRNEVA